MTDFIVSVGHRLREIRIKAGLTQEQVASRMHTKQEAIARIEADKRGSVSLRRIADYALACGMIPVCFEAGEPLELHFIPLEDGRQFAIANPQEVMTWKKYIHWKAWKDVETLQQRTLPCSITMAP